jgi:hypothetical protein
MKESYPKLTESLRYSPAAPLFAMLEAGTKPGLSLPRPAVYR